MSGADASKTVRIDGLDIIRGVAIALVILRHAWPNTFGGARIVGVVAIFALSGYLITGLLANDLRKYSRIRWKRFYTHRALRLLPALVTFLAAFAIGDGAFNVTGQNHLVPRSLILGATYTINLPGLGHTNGAVNHLWTLATEEQFYLIWPMILMLGFAIRRMALVVAMSGIVIIAAFAPQYETIYAWPSNWALAMVLGSAARLGQEHLRRWLPEGSRRSAVAASAGLLLILVLAFTPDAWWAYFLLGPLTSLATIALIVALNGWRTVRSPLLRPLVALGVVSYAAYLWNKPMTAWIGLADLGPWGPVLSIPATLFAAAISWFLVERPIREIRAQIDARRPRSLPRLEANEVQST